MAKIPIPSHLVTEIIENGSRVELIVRNGFKFICSKKDFSNYGAFKTSVEQGIPGDRNKTNRLRPVININGPMPSKSKRRKRYKGPKNESPQKGTGRQQV